MFKKPCDGPVMSLYDMKRRHPKTKRVQPHWGIDYGTAPDNTIRAAAHGVIKAIVRGHRTAGNYVVIKHPNGWETAYLHLASISVKVGDSITQGGKIGIKGNTGGVSTGVHLHFEISRGKWSGGSSLNVDPALYIDDPEVREIQKALNKLGYNLVVDGKYGAGTIQAVTDYQKKNKLIVDGISGRNTAASIQAAVKFKNPVAVSPGKKVNELHYTTSARLAGNTIEYITKAVDDKIINKSWLDKYKAKQLNDRDLIELDIFIRSERAKN